MIEGYGLSISGLDYLKNNGSSLIISVDCGIIATQEIDIINSLGMQIIITDHHNSKDTKKPDAYAIINPKQDSCTYPYKELAGVGVAYKLLMAIYKHLGLESDHNKEKYLDLVAVGTIADIVPLTGENRILATLGLKQLAKRRNLGLNSLMHLAGIPNKEPDVNDVIFSIAPRLNAAGRMGSAMRTIELLISNTKTKSKELAEIIERENSLRQQIDSKTLREADDIISKKYKNMDETYCIVADSDDWHPGVIGIVASKISEKYYRPTILISHNEGMGSGSGRSIADIDLFKAMEETEDLIENFGGHKFAVGLTILPEYIKTFEEKLAKYIQNTLDIKSLSPILKIDKKIELYEITNILLDWLVRLSPYGLGNPVPVFYTTGVQVQGYPYTVGKNHLKLKVAKDGCELDLIGFGLGNYLPLLKNKSTVDIAYTLETVIWQNKTSIQGNLKDLLINNDISSTNKG
jgi:single-stranded-DNA-specific exonuclease